MNPTSDRSQPAQTFYRRRFRAAVELRGLSMEGIARSCEVSYRHLSFVVTGQRKTSTAVLAKIRALLGEAGWLFATGNSPALRDDFLAAEVQPCPEA